MEKYKEPPLIKAGDMKVLLGNSTMYQAPLVDIRIIAEDNYQILIKELNLLREQDGRFMKLMKVVDDLKHVKS